jgi:hypothetical protein
MTNTKETVVFSLLIGMILILCALLATIERRVNIQWQSRLAAKGIIVLDVSTNYTTNWNGEIKWAK